MTLQGRTAERALEKLKHSKNAIKRTHDGRQSSKRPSSAVLTSVQAQAKLGWELNSDLEEMTTYVGPQMHDSFEQACERGDARFVKECIQGAGEDGWKLLHKNRNVLHIACWHAHYHVARLLIEYAPWLVEERDAMGSTVLMEACVGKDNHAALRVMLIRNLIGLLHMNVLEQDRNGDTCIHLLARTESVMIMRALFKATPKAILALEIRNSRGRTPIDIAHKCAPNNAHLHEFLNAHSGPAYAQLRERASAMITQEQSEKSAYLAELDALAYEMDQAQMYAAQIAQLCNEQHLIAEAQRQKSEQEFVELAMKNATGKVHAWLKSQYGINELNALAKAVRKDLRNAKDLAQLSDSDLKDMSKTRAREMLIRRKQNEAKAKAVTEFRSRNPPYENLSITG